MRYWNLKGGKYVCSGLIVYGMREIMYNDYLRQLGPVLFHPLMSTEIEHLKSGSCLLSNGMFPMSRTHLIKNICRHTH